MSNEFKQLIPPVIEIAKQVGTKLLEFWKPKHQLIIQRKQDNTLLTQADLAANEILHEKLHKLTPTIPVLSEEGQWPDFTERSQWKLYWLLDPLDGTRGFVERSKEFSVNIALIENHQPVLGIIYVPTAEICYYATAGNGAHKLEKKKSAQPIHCQPIDPTNIRILLGRYHRSLRATSALVAFPDYQLFRVNSSWKLGLIAEGQADIYPRLGPTGEWDTAAGQCILQEAGGLIVDLQGNPLQYNATASLSNPEFLAMGDPTQLDTLLEIINQRRIK